MKSGNFSFNSNLGSIELANVGRALVKSPQVGFIVYNKKIVYANRFACNLLGYDLDEIREISTLDLVHEEYKTQFKDALERRLNGEKFYAHYRDIPLKKKDGHYVFLDIFADTILGDDGHNGFLILIDTTKEREIGRFYKALKEINHIITQSTSKDELYERVCKSFVDNCNVKFAWVGEIDDEGKVISPKYSYGRNDNYIDNLISKGIIHKEIANINLKHGGIKVIESINECSYVDENIKKEMKKREFLSACSIPVKKGEKYVAAFSIYADEYFFSRNVLDILKEMQEDLSFSLERIEEIQQSISFYEAAKSSDWWFLMTDSKGNILFVNDTVSKMSGYSKEELMGNNPRIFKSGLHGESFYKDLWNNLLQNKIVDVIISDRRKDGTVFSIRDKIIPVELPGGIKRFVAIGQDVTKEMSLSSEAEQLKKYDGLTKLLNLNGFLIVIDEKIKNVKKGVLALIDIFNFSYINRAYGFEFGDKALQEIARRLNCEFKNKGCLSRIGSDDFAVFVNADDYDIAKIPANIIEIFQEPFKIDDKEIAISVNAGISSLPDDANNIKELMEKASIVLNESKKMGENAILFYHSKVDKNVEKYIYAENLLEKASRKSLFLLHYQPYVSSWDNTIFGLEALVRINDSDGTMHYPNAFIDYLEESRFLKGFEKWLLDKVEDRIIKWKKNISINISATSFKREDFIDSLIDVSKRVGDYLTIEITERTLMSSMEKGKEVINRLKNLNNPPKISIDDFGTGYASLSMLREFPIDIVKIDMSFVRNINDNRKNIAIVQTVIDLARALDIKTIAEGVETEEEYKTLKTLGADFIQGYLFFKPISEDKVEHILK